MLDRDRQRFQIHALLRDEAHKRLGDAGLSALQDVAALEELLKNRRERWRDCRECLEEIIPASAFLSNRGNDARARRNSFWGYDIATDIGEIDVGFQ